MRALASLCQVLFLPRVLGAELLLAAQQVVGQPQGTLLLLAPILNGAMVAGDITSSSAVALMMVYEVVASGALQCTPAYSSGLQGAPPGTMAL